jgi:hypothetical protein
MARAFPAHTVRPRVLTRLACTEYLEAIIGDERPDPGAYLSRVKECPTSQFIFADEKRPKFLWEDVELFMDVDRFHFAMVVTRQVDFSVLKPVPFPIT